MSLERIRWEPGRLRSCGEHVTATEHDGISAVSVVRVAPAPVVSVQRHALVERTERRSTMTEREKLEREIYQLTQISRADLHALRSSGTPDGAKTSLQRAAQAPESAA